MLSTNPKRLDIDFGTPVWNFSHLRKDSITLGDDSWPACSRTTYFDGIHRMALILDDEARQNRIVESLQKSCGTFPTACASFIRS